MEPIDIYYIGKDADGDPSSRWMPLIESSTIAAGQDYRTDRPIRGLHRGRRSDVYRDHEPVGHAGGAGGHPARQPHAGGWRPSGLWVDPLTLDLADIGDFDLALGDIPASLARIEAQADGLAHLLCLGGEHSISLPLLRSLRRRLGAPVALVHFDAHVDTWADNFGQAYAHGSVFYHAIREGLVDPKRMIQIGIRSPMQRDVWDWTIGQGVTILSAIDVHTQGAAAVTDRIRAVVGEAAAYLSFDIDALDPAFAPGTGTPESGGLTSWQAQVILRGLRFQGMDVVEVAPAYDTAEITALAAATVVWEYVALLQA